MRCGVVAVLTPSICQNKLYCDYTVLYSLKMHFVSFKFHRLKWKLIYIFHNFHSHYSCLLGFHFHFGSAGCMAWWVKQSRKTKFQTKHRPWTRSSVRKNKCMYTAQDELSKRKKNHLHVTFHFIKYLFILSS